MGKVWNKGFTKVTHPSLLKTSQTMSAREINNFAKWREKMKKSGKIRSKYPEFKKNGDLAELIGVILGDGHIRKFPRTEELSIFSNSNNPGFIKRYAKLVEKIFDKKPALTHHGSKNCTRIRVYQKHIASRLDLPYSPRGKLKIVIHDWILENKQYIVRYLRGLYEAEGSFSIHKRTYTHKFFFANRNSSMLSNVNMLMRGLGFHTNRASAYIQISRKADVYRAMELLQFRKY